MQPIHSIYVMWLLLPVVLCNKDVCSACGIVTQHINSQIQNSRFDSSASLSKGIFWENILEDICSEVSRYGRIKLEDGGVKYVPAFDQSGQPIEYNNFEFNRDLAGLYEHHCVGLVDDNYEELLEVLMETADEDLDNYLFDKFCKQITRSCVYILLYKGPCYTTNPLKKWFKRHHALCGHETIF